MINKLNAPFYFALTLNRRNSYHMVQCHKLKLKIKRGI